MLVKASANYCQFECAENKRLATLGTMLIIINFAKMIQVEKLSQTEITTLNDNIHLQGSTGEWLNCVNLRVIS